ncbi:unnamed protein product [Callosobruchus maculatus]|uniref:Uncharacterized protein n=1 Tax=Callosobruchus maculatus TaxID=64391 RepID=A0A653C315_CALMS|nr:unnamed protein product [Callosobruchus maculatus]
MASRGLLICFIIVLYLNLALCGSNIDLSEQVILGQIKEIKYLICFQERKMSFQVPSIVRRVICIIKFPDQGPPSNSKISVRAKP